MDDEILPWYVTTVDDQYPCPDVIHVADAIAQIARTTKPGTPLGYALWEYEPIKGYVKRQSSFIKHPLDPNVTRFRVYLTIDSNPGGISDVLKQRIDKLAANPPYNLHCTVTDRIPVLTGLVQAPSQWMAISRVVQKVHDDYKLDLTSCGIEKPQEWMGGEQDQVIAAHLVLQALHRARFSGVEPQQMIDLVEAVGIL